MPGHEDVEFKTLDGLALRGWLYPASQRGPGIVITPGVSKSHFKYPLNLHRLQLRLEIFPRKGYWRSLLREVRNDNFNAFSAP